MKKPAIVSKSSATQIKVVREFEGSVDSVWGPFTDASIVRQWMLGPPGWTMPVCEMDFHVGGKYKNVFQNEAEGMQINIVGTFRKIEQHSKIVQDEKHIIGSSDEGVASETTVTLLFEETGQNTNTVTTLIEYGSEKERDEALATGMEAAMEMGYQRIDELLVK